MEIVVWVVSLALLWAVIFTAVRAAIINAHRVTHGTPSPADPSPGGSAPPGT